MIYTELTKKALKICFDAHKDDTDKCGMPYRIPLKFIRLFQRDFAFDRDLRGNMYKCGNFTVKKHFIAWLPIKEETPPIFTGRSTSGE